LTRPIGYQPKGAVTASFDLNIQGYNEPRGREFEKRFHEKVRAIPGIESAALILIGSGTFVGLAIALAAGRFLEHILCGVQPTGPV
jgi:hypothetical protein